MNREIKFRGKRVDTGEWVYGYLCYLSYKAYIKDDSDKTTNPRRIDGTTADIRMVEVDPATVGQYTGLHDKNGKEIYEGDVVSFDDCTSTESGWWEQSCTGVVVWCNETVAFEVTDRLSAESYEVLDECVVIGNIYENPELLEGME